MHIHVATRKFDHEITETEANSILAKAAASFGKIKTNKKNEILFRPAQSVHRLKLSATVEKKDNGSSIITINGTTGISLGWGLTMVPLSLLLTLTVIGLILFIWMMSKSQKIVAKTFEQVSENALNMM